MSKNSKNDSSKYRVVPLMNYMTNNKKDLVKLLDLMGITVQEKEIEKKKIYYGSKKQGYKGEKALKPSPEYLCKLVETLHKNEYAKKVINSDEKSETKIKRLKLIEDETARKQASNYIWANYPLKSKDEKYMVFEGDSYPDIFIETDDKVRVLEGKWTELDVKEYTKYQKKRNQMVRHIHNALYKYDKQVYGFYIVSEEFKKKWGEKKLSETGFGKTVDNQFGIGGYEEKIKKAYKGCITWEKIVKEFPKVKKEVGWKCKPDS